MLVGRGGIRHAERDRLHPIAVALVVLGDPILAGQGPGEHKADAPLLEDVGDVVAGAGLQPSVGGLSEAKRVRVVVGRLGGVPHEQLEMVDAVDRHHVVGLGCGAGLGFGGHAAMIRRI